jgi:hypothetical protein
MFNHASAEVTKSYVSVATNNLKKSSQTTTHGQGDMALNIAPKVNFLEMLLADVSRLRR